MSLKRQSATHNLTTWLFVALILVAFGLRVYHLDGQSLWRDEALTLGRARQSLSQTFANRNLVQGVSSPDLHPPLYFLMLHGWRILAGESEFALRFPSLAASILTIAMFGAVANRIWGRETGLWAAALALLSPCYLWYAQEARMYALLVLETLILLYTLWPLLQPQSKWGEHIAFGLAALVLVYTHYAGVFVVGFAILAYLVIRLRGRAWWPVLIILAGIGLLAIPLYPNLRELLAASGFIAFHQSAPWTLLQKAANTFSLGSANPMSDPGWRLIPFVLLALAGALTLDIPPQKRRWRVGLVGIGGLIVPLLLFYLASWIQANYSNPRHLIALSPFWFLLMGHGAATLRRHLWPAAVLAGLAISVSGAMALSQTITDPPLVRDDVRGLAAYIETRARAGDAVLWHNAVMMETYAYYASDLPYTALPQYGQQDKAQILGDLEQWAQSFERIWFISYPLPDFFDKNAVPAWLSERLTPVDSSTFPASWTELHLNLYQWPRRLDSLPAEALPADLRQGPYLIRGVEVETATVSEPGIWLSLFWSLEGEQPEEPLAANVRLLDSRSREWTGGGAALIAPPSLDTAPGDLMAQQIWLPLPVGLAPVTYTLELELADAAQSVGAIAVQRPISPPQFKPVARYTGGPELLQAEWVHDEFRAGQWAVGYFVWRTQSPLNQDLSVTVRLVDWLGREVARQLSSLGPPDYPAPNWQPGEPIRSLVAIRLPFRVEGRYGVQVSLSPTDGDPLPLRGLLPGRQWASVGKIHLSDWPLELELPDRVTHRPEQVYLGDSIRLAGYEVRRDENILTVDLYWRCEQELSADYGVFVHVGQPGKAPLAQASSGPANWTRPVKSWREGEIILDSRQIILPPDLETEGLSIMLGMYDLQKPDLRLPLTVDGEAAPDNTFNLGPLTDLDG